MIIRLSVKKSSSEKNKQVKHPDDVELKCVFFLFSNEQIKKIFDEIYKRLTRKCIILSEVDGKLKEVGEFWEER